MLFNSLEFLIFFPIVVTGYFLAPFKWRWLLLLAASYYFYMAWKPVYIGLVILSTIVDYLVCTRMGDLKTKDERRPYMWFSVFVNLSLLFGFKYYNWFNDNVSAVAGQQILPVSQLILPMGISFYTLQTMSYTIDVYRGRLKPERHFGVFALYVSFFPQLVAGPIERAPNLLHQFWQKHTFDYQRVVDGLRLMAWGLFKKAVIADRLALYSKAIYDSPEGATGPYLALGTLFFCVQLYCDFSGYSDIAIGAAQVMGIKLMENFKRPFLARNIEELWGKRWHISLVSWLQDYLYNPLAYKTRRAKPWRRHSNILIVFFITGLWHGAAWKFVVWGMVNGTYVLLHVLTAKWRRRVVEKVGLDKVPRLHTVLSIAFTFFIFTMGSIFFLAKDLSDAFYIFLNMFQGWTTQGPLEVVWYIVQSQGPVNLGLALFGIVTLFTVEAVQSQGPLRPRINQKPLPVRWALTLGVVLCIALFGVFDYDEFIYFQF